ncbi:MAG: hypothetical protein GY694_14145 [Gammaproteobacteria bacterium]|nr:hypothetical protein [Gammaproteobacteria bacterium]
MKKKRKKKKERDHKVNTQMAIELDASKYELGTLENNAVWLNIITMLHALPSMM